jgi:Protein of unknown function (DUF2750)
MPYELSDEERDGVYAATDDKRCKYFVDKVADWGEVFTLGRGDRWAHIEDSDGERYLPVWPHPGFAKESLEGEWADSEIETIEVHKFLDVLENLHERGDGVALFRRPDGEFIALKPSELLEALTSELERME